MSERDAIVAVTDDDRELATAIRIALYRACPGILGYPGNVVPQVIAAHRATHAGKVERLREALEAVKAECANEGAGNPIVNIRIIDRCDEIARQALEASR